MRPFQNLTLSDPINNDLVPGENQLQVLLLANKTVFRYIFCPIPLSELNIQFAHTLFQDVLQGMWRRPPAVLSPKSQ